MANVTKIQVVIHTGSDGTDGGVYLGIGGREFRLNDPGTNDFQPDLAQTFILGTATNVANPTLNDPRSPYPLVTENLGKYPKYIRFEPADSADTWTMASVTVTANPGPSQIVYSGLTQTGQYMRFDTGNNKIFYFGE